MKNEPFVSAEGLSLKTPLGQVYGDVTFQLEKGRTCAFFGDAGCGKTALMLTLCGRMKASSGTAQVAGFDLRKKYRSVRHRSAVSFIPGLNDVQPFLRVRNITAAELALVGKKANHAATDAFLERCGFADKADVRFDDLDAYDTAYFGIVLACAADPELLCVDDVQSDLTQYQSVKLVKLLDRIAHEAGVTVVFCCSEYEIARHADGVVVLSENAEAQRQAVLRDNPDEVPAAVFGTGNGVVTGVHNEFDKRDRYDKVPALAGGEE